MEDKLTYSEAIAELESIMDEMENDNISVDLLSEKVKRASMLIRFCREKLTLTEKEVGEILKDIKPHDDER
jgi:exodeoxyribonuclease VII small subunit